MNDFIEYLRFPDIERAAPYTFALEKHGIPFQLDDRGMRLVVGFGNDGWNSQLILMLKEADFVKAQGIFDTEIPQDDLVEELEQSIENLDDEYFLSVLKNRSEHSDEEINFALKVAEDRNLPIPPIAKYPPKPVQEKEEQNIMKQVYSALLFIIASYFFFNKDIRFVLALVLVLFIHELGHYMAMKYYKYSDLKMFFIPLVGAFVSGNPKTISQHERIIIVLAGPVPGIIIGMFLYFYGMRQENEFLIITAKIFIYINVFNLLPFFPLDGGNVIGTIFFSKRDNLELIFSILSIVGLIYIALSFESYALLIFAAVMILGFIGRRKLNKLKKNLDDAGLNYNKKYEELTDEEYWQIRKIVIPSSTAFKNINPDEFKFSNKEEFIVKNIASLPAIPIKKDLVRSTKIIFFFIWFLFLFGPMVILFFTKLN